MANSDDAAALREIWDPEYLNAYEGKWIAFRMSFDRRDLPSASDLSVLLHRFDEEIRTNDSPLFAFVTFRQVFV
jgi:hypothetical protein